jgi:hypothetical protein
VRHVAPSGQDSPVSFRTVPFISQGELVRFRHLNVRLSLAALLFAVLPAASNAQDRQKEIRLDLARVQTTKDVTSTFVSFPGSVSFALFLTPRVALEPRLALGYSSTDDRSGASLGAEFFVPLYFREDGRSGPFIAPGFGVSKTTGDLEADARFDYGVDVGLRAPLRESAAWRFALTVRDGDSFRDPLFGVTLGVGLFFR